MWYIKCYKGNKINRHINQCKDEYIWPYGFKTNLRIRKKQLLPIPDAEKQNNPNDKKAPLDSQSL